MNIAEMATSFRFHYTSNGKSRQSCLSIAIEMGTFTDQYKMQLVRFQTKLPLITKSDMVVKSGVSLSCRCQWGAKSKYLPSWIVSQIRKLLIQLARDGYRHNKVFKALFARTRKQRMTGLRNGR